MKTRVLQVFSEVAPYAERIETAVRAYCDANGFEYAARRVAKGGRYWFSLDPIRDALSELSDGDRLLYLDGSEYFFDVALTPEKTIFRDDQTTPVRCGAYCESEEARWNSRRGHPGALGFVVGAAARAFVADWIRRADETNDRSPRSRDSFWAVADAEPSALKIFRNYYRFAAKDGYFVRRLESDSRDGRDAETERIFCDGDEAAEAETDADSKNETQPQPLETKGNEDDGTRSARRDGDAREPDRTALDGTEDEGAPNGGADDSANAAESQPAPADGAGSGAAGDGGNGTAGTGADEIADAPKPAPKRRSSRKKAATEAAR